MPPSQTANMSATHTEKQANVDATPSIHSSNIDDKELETAGYSRAMPRRFDSFSMMALSFDLTCTWLGVGASIGIALTQCSSAGVIWALLVAAFFIFVETLSMAELASAYPVTGAQYFWTFMVAGGPEGGKWAPFASFVTAWMNVFGWWLGLASVAQFTCKCWILRWSSTGSNQAELTCSTSRSHPRPSRALESRLRATELAPVPPLRAHDMARCSAQYLRLQNHSSVE